MFQNPQTEIVNLIADAGLTPTDADLHQLAKAVQSGKLIYADDTGTVNVIALNCVPAVAALQKGMVFIFKAAATNAGPTQATVNGLTAPVVHSNDLTPLLPFDINAGQMSALAYDGANFQLAWSTHSRGAALLQANFDFYVNGTTGSDTLYDGAAATVGVAGHGPFQTIVKAISAASFLNANGYTITIHVADGTYTAGISVTNVTNGTLYLQGNSATPDNCFLNATGAALVTRGAGVAITIDGFKVASATQSGLTSQQGANINFVNIDFGACAGAHVSCDTGGASCNGNYKISGSAGLAHVSVGGAQCILSPNPPNTVTITPGVTIGAAFIYCGDVGYVRCGSTNTTYAGYSNITTGQKYIVFANGVIDTGSSGASFFPGGSAGTNPSGGQYL